MDFGRIITAMVTPFDANGQINWDRTKALVDYLIEEQKTDALVVSGTTGESPTLTDSEKLQLFEAVVRYADGRCKVIAGTGSNDTAHTVHLTREAEATGVDGLLLVTPYYNRPSQEGLYRHFKTVAEQTKLPVMLYNVPKRTGVSLTAETTLRLAELPNVLATKESSGDLAMIAEIIERAPQGFRVYSGDDDLTLPMLACGASGVVSVASHVVGARMKAMVEAFLSGKVEESARMHRQLLPIFKGLFLFPSPAPVKYALQLHGQDVGGVRLPLVELSEEEKAVIRSLFA